MRYILLFFIFFTSHSFLKAQGGKIFSAISGKINFESEAPFENIKASSNDVKGLLDPTKKTFAFKVKMQTFDGFNSALQKEHFNENYIESNKFPDASFSGKIIEDVDFTKDGNYTVRAKGEFVIHGVAQERIIKSDVTIQEGKLIIKTAFTVLLGDHNIPIPKVVKDKLNGEINVQVNCVMAPR